MTIFRKYHLLLFLAAFLTLGSGCAALLVGGGVAGSYVLIAEDTIEGNFDVDFASLWFKSEEVLEEKGEIVFMDRKLGQIKALTAKNVNIVLTITSITENTSKLKVQAKKRMLPKVKEAQVIYNAIIRRI